MKLNDWRKNNNLTQKQVADMVGVDSTMISKYERELAKPTLFHLAVIHILTDKLVTVEDFLYENEEAAVQEAIDKASENPVQSRTCVACT